MVSLKGSFILMINIIFGLCIDNSWTLNAADRSARSIVPRRIPIRPLDRSTMRRLSLRATELNPDAESIYLPNHLTNQRPLQIMERISVPVDYNHPSAAKFNVLNFDAYVMKPNHGHSPTNPVTERVFHMVNQTGGSLAHHRGDTRTSSSQYKMHRTKNASSKKQKKPIHSGNGGGGGYGGGYGATQTKEFDDLEFYRAYLEQQKQAAMMKRLKPRTEPSSRLPIGIDYFEQKKKNRMAFPPITYAPLYMNNLQRAHHHEEVEASNVQMQRVQMQHPNSHTNHILNQQNQQNDEIPSNDGGGGTTPIPSIPTTNLPEYAVQNDAQSQTIPPSSDVIIPNESETAAYSHSGPASEPEMYKFTIDDVVFKPQQPGVVAYPFIGPVTLPPPALNYQNAQNFVRTVDTNYNIQSNNQNNNIIVADNTNNNENGNNNLPVSANTIYENRFDAPYQTPQLNYPPNALNYPPNALNYPPNALNYPPNALNYPPNALNYPPRLVYRRPGRHPYSHLPIDVASSHQQIQKYSIDPVEITTQINVVATENAVNNNNNNNNNNYNHTMIAAAIKPIYEMDLKRTEKRNKKRRPNTDRHIKNEARKLNHNDPFGTNLEFSNSYTKRRTQGYNSEEEPATTPISPVKLKHFVKHDNIPLTENTTRNNYTTKTQKIKHFQDTLTEQQSPHQIDFGHLTENPAGWEERYERKNLKSQRHQGRVKWGDRKGNFGEHYYDLNHHRTPKPSNNTRTTSSTTTTTTKTTR